MSRRPPSRPVPPRRRHAEIGGDDSWVVAHGVASRRRSCGRSRAPRRGRKFPSRPTCRARSAESRRRTSRGSSAGSALSRPIPSRVGASRRFVEAEQGRVDLRTWRGRFPDAAGRRRAEPPAGSSARATSPMRSSHSFSDRRVFPRRQVGAPTQPNRGRKPEARVSRLCCATIRFPAPSCRRTGGCSGTCARRGRGVISWSGMRSSSQGRSARREKVSASSALLSDGIAVRRHGDPPGRLVESR